MEKTMFMIQKTLQSYIFIFFLMITSLSWDEPPKTLTPCKVQSTNDRWAMSSSKFCLDQHEAWE